MPVAIRRRELIATLSGAAVSWPLGARAQQPAMPVIGVLHHASPDVASGLVAAFQHGLKETGFIENQNVQIEYRWAHYQYDRLPQLAADLVRRQVSAILANTPTMQVAKAGDGTAPGPEFSECGDPVARHAGGGALAGPQSCGPQGRHHR